MQAYFLAIIWRRTHRLHSLHNPVPLSGIDYVHKLGTNRMAIGSLKCLVYLTQRGISFADVQTTGLENRIKVGRRQMVKA